MKAVLQVFALAVLALCLLACHEDIAPIVSGSVSAKNTDGAISERQLAQGQLEPLTSWLKQHRLGWKKLITPSPIETDYNYSIRSKHADGTVTLIKFQLKENGGATAVLSGAGAPSQSFDVLRTYNFSRSLTTEEFQTLRSLVDVKK